MNEKKEALRMEILKYIEKHSQGRAWRTGSVSRCGRNRCGK